MTSQASGVLSRRANLRSNGFACLRFRLANTPHAQHLPSGPISRSCSPLLRTVSQAPGPNRPSTHDCAPSVEAEPSLQPGAPAGEVARRPRCRDVDAVTHLAPAGSFGPATGATALLSAPVSYYRLDGLPCSWRISVRLHGKPQVSRSRPLGFRPVRDVVLAFTRLKGSLSTYSRPRRKYFLWVPLRATAAAV